MDRMGYWKTLREIRDVWVKMGHTAKANATEAVLGLSGSAY